jgi:hypothetical protein
MPTHKPLPSYDTVRAILRYNPHTGTLMRYRKTKKVWVKLNSPKVISLNGVKYQTHRLAYLLHTGKDPGELMVDHINGDDNDHRAVNLRAVNGSQNSMNRRTTSATGHKGIYFEKSGRYAVQVCRTQGRGQYGAHGSRDGFKRKTDNLFASWCLKECKDFYIEWVYNNGLEQYCRPADLEPVTDCTCPACSPPTFADPKPDKPQPVVSVTLPTLPDDPNDLKPGDCWLNDLINGASK